MSNNPNRVGRNPNQAPNGNRSRMQGVGQKTLEYVDVGKEIKKLNERQKDEKKAYKEAHPEETLLGAMKMAWGVASTAYRDGKANRRARKYLDWAEREQERTRLEIQNRQIYRERITEWRKNLRSDLENADSAEKRREVLDGSNEDLKDIKRNYGKQKNQQRQRGASRTRRNEAGRRAEIVKKAIVGGAILAGLSAMLFGMAPAGQKLQAERRAEAQNRPAVEAQVEDEGEEESLDLVSMQPVVQVFETGGGGSGLVSEDEVEDGAEESETDLGFTAGDALGGNFSEMPVFPEVKPDEIVLSQSDGGWVSDYDTVDDGWVNIEIEDGEVTEAQTLSAEDMAKLVTLEQM